MTRENNKVHEKENIKHGGIIFDRYGELKPGCLFMSHLSIVNVTYHL